MIIIFIIIPAIEKACPFTTFNKNPAAPKPDSMSSKVHAHPLPLYIPNAVMSEAIPKIIKNPGPIMPIAPNRNDILRVEIDITNKIAPLNIVRIIIIKSPLGIFLFNDFATFYLNVIIDITFIFQKN